MIDNIFFRKDEEDLLVTRKTGWGFGENTISHCNIYHLPVIALWTGRCYKPQYSWWHTASATPDLRLASQPQSITALQLQYRNLLKSDRGICAWAACQGLYAAALWVRVEPATRVSSSALTTTQDYTKLACQKRSLVQKEMSGSCVRFQNVTFISCKVLRLSILVSDLLVAANNTRCPIPLQRNSYTRQCYCTVVYNFLIVTVICQLGLPVQARDYFHAPAATVSLRGTLSCRRWMASMWDSVSR